MDPVVIFIPVFVVIVYSWGYWDGTRDERRRAKKAAEPWNRTTLTGV